MPVTRPLEERFWEKVDKSAGDDGCWLWTAHTANGGYGSIRGKKEGRRANLRAHVLSWEMHNGPVPVGYFVCHKCDNPPCVNPKHLFVGTAADNFADMMAKGRHRTTPLPGAQNGNAKITEGQAITAFHLRETGASRAQIADTLGVTLSAVDQLLTRRTWRHLPLKKIERFKFPDRKGALNSRAKLTEDDVRAIRLAFQSGVSQGKLAKQYGLSQPSISAMILRKTWSHVL